MQYELLPPLEYRPTDNKVLPNTVPPTGKFGTPSHNAQKQADEEPVGVEPISGRCYRLQPLWQLSSQNTVGEWINHWKGGA